MIYMIRSGPWGDVKIGVAGDPLKRMKQIQTNHPAKLRLIRVFEGDRAEEAALHERFKNFRKAGEWFAFKQEMLLDDLGLTARPIPQSKRAWPDLSTPWGRYHDYRVSLVAAAGGEIAIAQALGVAPWAIKTNGKAYFAVAVALARKNGAATNLEEALALRAANKLSSAMSRKGEKKQRHCQWVSQRKKEWLEKNPSIIPWWPTPSTSQDSAPTDGVAA